MKIEKAILASVLYLGAGETVLAADCTVSPDGTSVVCNPGEAYDPTAHGGKPIDDYESVKIVTTGYDAFGIVQWSNDTDFDDVTIETSGDVADGVRLNNWDPNASFKNLTVKTTGSSADGINLGRDSTEASVIVSEKADIFAAKGMGIRANSSRLSSGPQTITFNGSSKIVTEGSGAFNEGHAVFAGTNKTACGPFGLPLYDCKAAGAGEIYLLGGTGDIHEITTQGNGANGIYAFGRGFIRVNNIDVETQGRAAHGIVAERRDASYYDGEDNARPQDYSGSVELIGNVSVKTSGAGAYAMYVNSSRGDGKDDSGKVASIRSYNSETGKIVSDKVYTIDGNMFAENAGWIDLWMGNGSNFTGTTGLRTGGVIDLHVGGRASVWNITGNSTLTNLDLAGSAVRFVNESTPLVGMTLTVQKNYRADNGYLYMNTVLGDDTSATDRLIVKGDTAGKTNVVINNAGGLGAPTVEGIKIVDVAGKSDGLFWLLGDYETKRGDEAVVAGAYAYTLHKNGISTPKDGDWYLRSDFYNPGVSAYESYAQTLMDLNGLSTLQQRTGNRHWAGMGNGEIEQGADAIEPGEQAPLTEASASYTQGSGIWGRVEASAASTDFDTSTSGSSYDLNRWKMQAGVDAQFVETEAGKLIGGVIAHYGNGSADTFSRNGDGSVDTDVYGAGATLTWYGTNGFYVDGQAQYNWFNSSLSSDLAGGLVEDNDGSGYAVSIEAGKRIALDQSWSLTPQAQLAYSAVEFDDFVGPFGEAVSLGNAESLRGRIGLTVDRESSTQAANGTLSRSHLYGIANLYYEFLDGSQIDVAGVNFVSGKQDVWGGIGIGGSHNWNDDRYSLFGEVSVDTSLQDFGDSHTLNGTAGFRIRF